MGGEPKLEAVVDGVYKMMRDDPEIGKQFARFRLERLKDRTVDYLRGEFGSTPYKGSDLWISHSHIGVNNHTYDIMMRCYVKMLKKERIKKQETSEILESLEKMRKPIVDSDLKFKNMYLRHVEQEAEKAGGDGWGMVATSKKERDEKERATLELIAKHQQEELMAKEREKLYADHAMKTKAADPKTDAKATPPRPRSKRVKAPCTQFAFQPKVDEPPEQVPSSLPSGAELLYRLSNAPMPCGSCHASATATAAAARRCVNL